MTRAVFLDRDGVLIEKAPAGAYITGWPQVQLLAGVAEAVRLLRESGFLVIVATNQAGIGKGLMSEDDLRQIHAKLKRDLAAGGGFLTAIYFCPHPAGTGCGCRKPAPGMLHKAVQEFAVDLRGSWMVGDSAIDVEAGHRAGCRTVLIADRGEGMGPPCLADLMVGSLPEAVRGILSLEQNITVGRVARAGSPRP